MLVNIRGRHLQHKGEHVAMHKWIMFVVFIAASVFGLYLLAFELPEKPVDESANLPEGMSCPQAREERPLQMLTLLRQTSPFLMTSQVEIRATEPRGYHPVQTDLMGECNDIAAALRRMAAVYFLRLRC